MNGRTKKPLLTILTPTYNRRQLLKNSFESLNKQTCTRFQWLIVDDGSSDNTNVEVESFKEKSEWMDIEYVFKENGGKHTALNAAHPYVKGDFVLFLDSDDTLTEDAVELVYKAWKKYNDQHEVGLVTFLKGKDRKTPNAYVRDPGKPVDIIGYPRICKVSSDCCEVIRTELFLKYPFPEYPNEKFVSEGALWNRVGMTHKCVYINKVIYLCDYLQDGLTKAGRAMRIRNPYGGMYTSQLRMVRKNFLKERIKAGMLYDCYGFFANLSIKDIIFRDSGYQLMKTVCLLPGFGLYILWGKRRS